MTNNDDFFRLEALRIANEFIKTEQGASISKAKKIRLEKRKTVNAPNLER